VKRQVEPFEPFGLLAVFAILWIPSVNVAFFDAIHSLLNTLGIDDLQGYCGQELYRFWQPTPDVCVSL
jgi:hypothetical protein